MERNQHRRPQKGPSDEKCSVSIVRYAKKLDISGGDFPLVVPPNEEEAGATAGMFNYLCQISQNQTIRDLATIGETENMSITGGFFPVGNIKAVEKLMQQRNDNKNAKEGQGRLLIMSPLIMIDLYIVH